jgi:hypothetical protein
MGKYTVHDILLEMDPLTRIRYTGKYGQIFTEATKPPRDILELLRIELPMSSLLVSARFSDGKAKIVMKG